MDRSRESAVAPRRLVILGSAGSSVELLLEQAALHGVKNVCLRDAKAAADAAARAPELVVLAGEAGVRELISRAAADAAAAGLPLTVLNGIVGAAIVARSPAALDVGAT